MQLSWQRSTLATGSLVKLQGIRVLPCLSTSSLLSCLQMARQRSAPPALSLETVEEASSPLSTATSELGESDSPERLSKRLKPFSGEDSMHGMQAGAGV